jgi:hypothetical protein
MGAELGGVYRVRTGEAVQYERETHTRTEPSSVSHVERSQPPQYVLYAHFPALTACLTIADTPSKTWRRASQTGRIP